MPEIHTKHILLISKEQELDDLLSRVLVEAHYQIHVVEDSLAMNDFFSKQYPDLILLNMHIADVDSSLILAQLHSNANERIPKIPVIIASDTGDLVEISSALKLGIKDYFIKSHFDSLQLLTKIKKQLGEAPITGGGSASSASVSLDKIKLLIVEDDKFLRDLAAQKITKEGLIVLTAVDGEQGIAMIEKELPDIILLDILLPGIDGYEVLKRVRANPALKAVHVAMLSNFGQREDIEKALNAGADQFLVKANYTLDEIVEEVKKMVATPRK